MDSSATVKRYVQEAGSEEVSKVYEGALIGKLAVSFSSWNIGEVLGVLDRYNKRGWLDAQGYSSARSQFIGETLRLLRLRLLTVVPLKARLLAQAWRLIEEYHVCEADALQVVTAKHVEADTLYTGDEKVHEIAVKEGVDSVLLR